MHNKTIAFVLAAICLMATPVFAESWIKVIPESVNFGQVKRGQIATAKFQVQNTGNQAVSIQWMELSKPGLIAQVQPTINAGSSVELLVNWNTAELLGELEGQITLGLTDPENPEVILMVNGTVIE